MKSLLIKIIISVLLLFTVIFSSNVFADKNEIYMMKISDAISPGVADFIISGIKKASDADAACMIIELDTPGGLAESH